MALAEGRALRLRFISAAVMAPVALAAVWLGSPVLPALVGLVAFGMGWEWLGLCGRDQRSIVSLLSLALSLAAVVLAADASRLALGLAILAGALSAQGARSPWTAPGLWLVTFAAAGFVWLAAEPGAGRSTLFWLLATVWATDTGAYAAGRLIGGPRLAPRLSPNKTWAGGIGGLVAAALVGWGTAALTGASPLILVPTAISLGLVAELGDLAESAAKRRFGVKDSGSLIPGHGGLLDRLDGLMAATLALVLIVLASGASPLTWRL